MHGGAVRGGAEQGSAVQGWAGRVLPAHGAPGHVRLAASMTPDVHVRCTSPPDSVPSPRAMLCSMASNPGYLNDDACAVRGRDPQGRVGQCRAGLGRAAWGKAEQCRARQGDAVHCRPPITTPVPCADAHTGRGASPLPCRGVYTSTQP